MLEQGLEGCHIKSLLIMVVILHSSEKTGHLYTLCLSWMRVSMGLTV